MIDEQVRLAKTCSSKKQASPYIKRIRFISNGLLGPAGVKATDVANELEEYCNTRSDKSRHEVYLNNMMGTLENLINSEE